MGYYDLSVLERKKLNDKMRENIVIELKSGNLKNIIEYASDPDIYIRKNCYLILGRMYRKEETNRITILHILDLLSVSEDDRIRQTSVFLLGEIGKHDFNAVKTKLEIFFNDTSSSVKNGLTGAIKQIGQMNPEPVIAWVREIIKSCNEDIQRRIIHGLELRGRTHPEDILPVIRQLLQTGMNRKTREMIIHVIGQISYKNGCLQKVTSELKKWNDNNLVEECRKEIINVHLSYKKFSFLSSDETEKYMNSNL
ncbi:MAG: HEAT repeat domain-containing protein [Spirochaetes bacterium]|nr:HEAT repeat domain-containing protein [Spirochaetota bacterium]